MTNRALKALEYLEFGLASDFSQEVSAVLRRLSDGEMNTLYLMTHTGPNMGDYVNTWRAVLLPLWQLRRDIAIRSELGPVVAPDLYCKGAGHDCPF